MNAYKVFIVDLSSFSDIEDHIYQAFWQFLTIQLDEMTLPLSVLLN